MGFADNKIDKRRKNRLITFVEKPAKEKTVGRSVKIYNRSSGSVDYVVTTDYPSSSFPVPLGFVSSSYSTPATQQIGKKVFRTYHASSSKEQTHAGGVSVTKNVTIFGPTEQVLGESSFNQNRQGRNVVNMKHFRSTNLPLIRINAKDLIDEDGNIDHDFEIGELGQGSHSKKFNSTTFRYDPYVEEHSKLTPQMVVEKGGRPLLLRKNPVKDMRIDLSQLVDADVSTFEGAIDPLNLTRTLIDNNPEDHQTQGVKGYFSSGFGSGDLLSETVAGAIIVDSKYEYEQGSYGIFEDANDQFFPGKTFPQVGNSGSLGYVYSIPGYVSDKPYDLSPFKEKRHSAYLYGVNITDLATSASMEISPIGTRFKSATCGLLFGESNVLGTDSIAFGGFKK